MKRASILLAATALSAASPALAETIVVHEGGSGESADVATRFAGAYNVQHADFYINASGAASIATLEANIATTTAQNPAWVTIYADDISGGAYANAQAWVTALNTHIANLRSALPNVKVAVITPLPKTGDATYSSRLRTVIGLLRGEELAQIDRIIDFAANPSMNDKTAPTTQFADANLYSSNLPTACTTACTLSSWTTPCDNTTTTGGSKGNDFLTRQYACAMGSILAGKYPWTVYEMPVTFSTFGTFPTTDPPAYTLAQPDDVPTTGDTSGWIPTASTSLCGGNGCYPTLPPGSEKKFRLLFNGTFVGRFDSVRAPGLVISGHCHSFFNNTSNTGSSTYKTLRASASISGIGAGSGGLLNPSPYWEPCLLKDNALGDGITRVKKIELVVGYYEAFRNDVTIWDFPRGINFVFATNMDDPDDNRVKGQLTAYTQISYVGTGWIGWHCFDNTSIHQKYLANTDNSDALSGCPSTSKIYAEATSPEFMDGVNLRSPDGYRHVYHAVQNNNAGKLVGPDNWYPIPMLRIKPFFGTNSDRSTLYLDSDAPAATAAGHAMRKGESFHADYVPTWDYPTMQLWSHNCIGAKSTSTDNFTPHECDASFLSGTQRLIGGISGDNSPDGSRSPQVSQSLSYPGTTGSHFFDVPAMSDGSGGAGNPPVVPGSTSIGNRGRGRGHKKKQ